MYSKSGPEETKKLDGFITAAFWIGVDHAENDLRSIKIRLPTESYDYDVANMMEFTSLLVQRQINFTVEFFVEPPQRQGSPKVDIKTGRSGQEGKTEPDEANSEPESDYEVELLKIKEQFEKGQMTREQFDSRKGAILKKWKEGIENRLNQ